MSPVSGLSSSFGRPGGGKQLGGRPLGGGARPMGSGKQAKATGSSNPFQDLDRKRRASAQATRAVNKNGAALTPKPGRRPDGGRAHQRQGSVANKPPAASPVAKPVPAPVAEKAVLQPLLSASDIVDPDQRQIYMGPLRAPDPAPLLQLLHPRVQQPVGVWMLKDWEAGGAFLGVAVVEFATAAALKAALPDLLLLSQRRKHGDKMEETPGVGVACMTARNLGVQAFKSFMAKGNGLGSGGAGELDSHTLEILGAAHEGLAQAALAEFAQVAGATKTAKTLRQIVRRLQMRALLRRVPESMLWRGVATGLPLPEGPAKHMLAVLDALDWKAMGNNRNPTGLGKINVENSFSLGMATMKLPSSTSNSDNPFATPFAFRPGLGVWDGGSVKKKHREVWDAAMAMLRAVDTTFHCTSIGFNKNFRGSPHRDEKDAGPQVATGLGDYNGGYLRVQTQTGVLDVNTRNRWCRFDGRYEHEVLPFSGGTRYSVIFYQLEPAYAVDLSTTIEGTSSTEQKAAADVGSLSSSRAPQDSQSPSMEAKLPKAKLRKRPRDPEKIKKRRFGPTRSLL